MTVIILAAGQSKRMKSRVPKVAHSVLGIPIIRWIIESVRNVGVDKIVVVTGFGANIVESLLQEDILFVRQNAQLGTGHAVMMAEKFIDDEVLVLPGDVPLISQETLLELIEKRRRSDSDVSVLTFVPEDPAGYGRVVRQGSKIRIIEDADVTDSTKDIPEVNSSIYAFKGEFLRNSLGSLSNDNAQQEYYLTDVVLHAERATTVVADDSNEIQGVNDRTQLARVQRYAQQRINDQLMKDGVTIHDPQTVYISPGIQIGEDTIVEPFTFILGNSVVGSSCIIGPMTRVVDSEIGNSVSVIRSEVEGALVTDGARIGPFSRVRPGSVIGADSAIGNFVEIKNSVIGNNTKAMHLSYLGDAQIGNNVNVGAGTITCNYDGNKKHRTAIEDGAFIGSNSALVAPVTVGAGSIVAAGSVITDDVAPFSLALARARQVTKVGKYRDKTSGKENEE